MANVLNFRSEIDEDSVELFVGFKIAPFSAEASAWFSQKQIPQFIDQLSKYPLDDESLPVLSGGFWNKEGKQVVQEHVHISARPAGNHGNVILLIRLAEPTDDGVGPKFSAAAHIDMSYSEISEISKGLMSLMKSDFPEGHRCQSEFSLMLA